MANLNQFCDFTKLIGIDIAKSVFQIYSCDTQTGEITNMQVKRDKVLESLANCGKCLIGMEACGSSQYWARKLQALGHTVRLMDPKLVKPFVRHNKSDKADAEGVYHALVSGVRAVAVKTETERDIQTLLTMQPCWSNSAQPASTTCAAYLPNTDMLCQRALINSIKRLMNASTALKVTPCSW